MNKFIDMDNDMIEKFIVIGVVAHIMAPVWSYVVAVLGTHGLAHRWINNLGPPSAGDHYKIRFAT